MRSFSRSEVIDLVTRAINTNANSQKRTVALEQPIDLYMNDSIEFVKVLISLEELMSIEFVPDELKIDHIKTITELVDMICFKVGA